MTQAVIKAGLRSAVAAHPGARISGKAHNVAPATPTQPSTNHRVTTQSPSSGRPSAAVSQGMKA